MNTNPQRKSIIVFASLVLMMALALVLRLVGIGKESLWWDEYTSHVYLNAPSLYDFLVLNRTLDPLTLPFYYTLEYLWTHYVHDSVLSLRLMSIAIGIATIPLLYALGRRLFGTWAGLTAAALLAVSPTHIHHSQSIRMYVVFIFLAAVVAWTFVRLLEKSRLSLWALHGAASFLLYWTHPFAGLVPAALGGFLLLRFFSRRSFFIRWTLLQCLLFAPTVLYLSLVRFWPQNTTTDWIAPPSLSTLFADLFFDDISAFHWQFRLGEFALKLGVFRLGIDVLFAGLLIAGLVYLALFLRREKEQVLPRKKEYSLLLLVWLLLPPLMLFAVSWLVRPCMFPRYTVHCTLALYLLLGGAVEGLKTQGGRIVAVLVLSGLMLLQWAWLQPGPQRTDWRSAGLLLHEQVRENDVVLVENLLWRDVFTHNLKHMTPGPLPVPVAAADKAPLLAAQAALGLGMFPRHCASGPPPRVWAVIVMDYFEPGPPTAFEECLKRWSIPFERRFYPSVREIYVYRMEPSDAPLPDTMQALFENWDKVTPGKSRNEGDLDHHAMQAFGDLATELALKGRPAPALEVLDGIFNESSFAREIYGNLRQAIASGSDIAGKAAAIRRLWEGYGFRDNGQAAYMRQAFKQAAELDPQHTIANFELGLELAAVQDYKEARQALLRVADADNAYRDMLKSLIDSLDTGKDVPAKLDAVNAYRKALMALASNEPDTAERLLRAASDRDPGLAAAQLMLGYVLTKHGQLAQADEALNNYLSMNDSPDVDAFANTALMHAENNRPKEVEAALQKLFESSPSAQKVYGRLLDAAQSGGDLPRTAASIRAFWKGFELRGQGRTDEARDAFSLAVNEDPENAYANLELGLQLAAEGDTASAATALKKVSELDSSYQDMLASLIKALENNEDSTSKLAAVTAYRNSLFALGRKEMEQAEQYLQQALQLDPQLSEAQLMLGYVLTERDLYDKAEEALRHYLAINDRPDVDAYAHMALIQAEHDRPDLVEKTLNLLFEKDPRARKIYGSLLDAVVSKSGAQQAAASIRALWEGFDARRNGQEEEAQNAFAKAVELNPGNTLANLEYGLDLAAGDNRPAALEALKRAGDQDPEYGNMLQHLLRDLENGAETSNSVKAVRAYRHGLLAQSRGKYEEAVTALEEAVQADTRMDDAHTSRVFNLVILRRFDEAMAGIQRYLAGTSAPAAGAYGLLAVVHIAKHNTEEALRAVNTAVTMDPAYGDQFGPVFSAVLEAKNYEKARVEMDTLKAQGIDLFPLMDELVRDYLNYVSDAGESGDKHQAEKEANTYWKDMLRFMEEDAAGSPLSGGVLFTGSSTARMWDVKKCFPDIPVLNRGFGGSAFSDVSLFAGEIIGTHKPDAIVLYSGDNDIAHGKSAEQTAQDCVAAVDSLRAVAPQSRIIVLGTKPSGSRWELYPVMQKSNALIAEQLKSKENVIFLDFAHLLLGTDGLPLPECYLEDRLHLSDEGYHRWSEALRPYLAK